MVAAEKPDVNVHQESAAEEVASWGSFSSTDKEGTSILLPELRLPSLYLSVQFDAFDV